MAIITNTITTYFPKNIREDLADVIYNISPTDTPLLTMAGRGKVSNTYFEWQVDQLAGAVTTNAQFDGDDVVATTDSRTATTRVGNYTQISRKIIEVSGSVEAVDKAGMKTYLAYELAKASSELKRDMEATLTSDQVAVAGGTGTARKTAALGGWLITNVQLGTGTLAAVPVMSSGGSLLSGYPATAAVAGTTQTFTSTLLKTGIQNVWTQGGNIKYLMLDPTHKVTFSGFSGIATQYKDIKGTAQAALVGAADVWVSDFGVINVIVNRFQPTERAYILDPDMVEVDFLRPFKTEIMAKTGDAEKRMLLVEYGFKMRQQKGCGVIRDLT